MGRAKDIREAVEEELSHDRLLDAAGITVRNLDGSVALTGTVPSYQQYLEGSRTSCWEAQKPTSRSPADRHRRANRAQ